MNTPPRFRCAVRLARQILAALGGAVILAALFGYLGSNVDAVVLGSKTMGDRTIGGAIVGGVIGALLGCGLLNGMIGSMTIWVVGFAVLGAICGPGVDLDPVSSALISAALGFFLGLIHELIRASRRSRVA